MMRLDLESVRANARQADTEDLLDRMTVYRAGMEPDALAIIEQELRDRGVTEGSIRDHAEKRRQQGSVPSAGLPARCCLCPRPAVVCVRRWHRLWGLVPTFPRQFHYCAEHRPADLFSTGPGQ